MPMNRYEWSVIALITLVYALANAATFTETWDGGSGWRGGRFEEQCEPYNFAIVADPTDRHNQVVRVENRLQRCGSARGHGAARTELRLADRHLGVQYQQDFWWKARVYIPLDWPSGDLPVSWLTVMQINVGNRELGWDPDFKLVIYKDQTWRFLGPGGGTFAPIARGAWTEFVIHHRRSTGRDGVTEVWMNGKQVVTYRGKTTFAAIERGVWRFGIYATVSNTPRPYVLYFDDLQISSKPLAPGAGTSPRRTHP
jgi:hypothetical protein